MIVQIKIFFITYIYIYIYTMGIDYKKKYLKYKNKYLEAKKLYGGDFEEFTHEDGTPILYKVVDEQELRDDEGAFFLQT